MNDREEGVGAAGKAGRHSYPSDLSGLLHCFTGAAAS